MCNAQPGWHLHAVGWASMMVVGMVGARGVGLVVGSAVGLVGVTAVVKEEVMVVPGDGGGDSGGDGSGLCCGPAFALVHC
jgi:hypothetical protein